MKCFEENTELQRLPIAGYQYKFVPLHELFSNSVFMNTNDNDLNPGALMGISACISLTDSIDCK